VDTLVAGEACAAKARRSIVLSRTFLRGDRDVQARFLEAMTLVQRFEKPNYFVTTTCNPYWDEVITQLLLIFSCM
jgi:hypothetical protein